VVGIIASGAGAKRLRSAAIHHLKLAKGILFEGAGDGLPRRVVLAHVAPRNDDGFYGENILNSKTYVIASGTK